MSEEAQAEVQVNPLEDMIQHAIDQNFNKANNIFNDMMTIRMSDLLDQEKVKMADQVYNGVDPDDEDDILGDEESDQLELDLEGEDDDEEDEDWEESDSEEDEEELEDEDWEEASFEEDDK